MQFRIKKVVVLGSGVMGSGISCQLANVGLEVLMLDILPGQLSDDGKNNQSVRNQVAKNALDKAIKLKPDYADAYSNLGYILLDKGQLIEAELALGFFSSWRSRYRLLEVDRLLEIDR